MVHSGRDQLRVFRRVQRSAETHRLYAHLCLHRVAQRGKNQRAAARPSVCRVKKKNLNLKVLQLVPTISKTRGMSVLPVVSAGDPELLRVFRRPTKTNTFKEFVGELERLNKSF